MIDVPITAPSKASVNTHVEAKKQTYVIPGPNVRHHGAADAGFTTAAGFARIL